ncbi:catalytic LigB subunit of aromatic ring-opening dioxygenase [Rhodopirellula europaea 6C]|uniref:Catalytic LigB subunit of aromatic ring-opening dioxygenase n=2 Tax=Rhodopirellula TaxID=265488 RepID=M2A6N5_9BACT|nr:catalytic LigB subunit of aromatic ring-opening dioxygenase [Rhodopirellula europaea 6C]
MPALFVGHGSPMNALEDNRFVQGFRSIVKTIPKPKAILCISAHWYTRGTKVTAMSQPKTIHDFGGFPQALHEFQYPAPGSPELAKATASLVPKTPVALDQSWGLDHGAWAVLTHLYPNADIPVVQMSLDRTQTPEFHFELGKQLEVLRQRGILIVGSGNIVHNLRLVDFQNMERPNHGFDWAVEAQNFVNQQLANGDYEKLIDYSRRGRAISLAVPTPDHYLPLLYVLGLQHQPDQLQLFNNELVAGSISMTSVRLG